MKNEQIVEEFCRAGLEGLSVEQVSKFSSYLDLMMKWNAKTNLTAIRDETGIVRRHFVESALCSRNIPGEVQSLLDFGSGGGFPGVPIAIMKPEIRVMLAESQGKKAAFLSEVCRQLTLNAGVHSKRAEELSILFDCVTLRAVDKMALAISAASKLVRVGGYLVVMTSHGELLSVKDAAGSDFEWQVSEDFPGRELLVAVGRHI